MNKRDPTKHKTHQLHRPLCRTTFLILSLAALTVHADFNGSDEFSSGTANWDTVLSAGTGNLTVSSGHYEYTATGVGTKRDMAFRRWNVNHGSYTNDWAVQVDVHLDAFPGLMSHQSINLNLVIQGSTNSIEVGNYSNFYAVSINRDARPIMDFESGLGGITTEVTNSTTDAALRISFDSTAKTLTAWYDADGAANGYTWIPMETVSIPTGSNGWGMTSDSLFSALLLVGSGVNSSDPPGSAPDIAVTGDQAYFDNFLATSGPCPANSFVVYSGEGVSVSAAFDGTNYLVGINRTGTVNEVAQLISAIGAPVGPLISLGRSGGAPMVAFDGTNYLMVWPDEARSDGTNYNAEVRGQFISRSGALVGPNFVISSLSVGPVDEHEEGVVFDGNNYLVMYGIGTNLSFDTALNSLAARFVTPAGTVGPEITIETGELHEQAVAFNGTSYLVTWMQHNGGNSNDVYGVLISKTSTLSVPFRINQNTSTSHNPLNVASDGSNFFVVWPYDTGSGTETPALWELHGRLVTAGGGFGSTEFTVAGVTNNPFFPAIAFDGANYLVTWTDRSNSNDWNITGQLVSKTGALLGSALSLVNCPGNQGLSPVVYGSGKDLVLWTDGITPSTGVTGTTIKGLFLPVALTITTASPLPSGTVGMPYTETMQAAAGTTPYSWSVVSGGLPTGLDLVASSGAITGTPTVATTANFTVRVTGADSLFSEKEFSLTINPASSTTASWSSVTQKCKTKRGVTACALSGQLTVANTGATDMPAVDIRFFLSADSTFDPGTDTPLEEITTKAIKAGKPAKLKLKKTVAGSQSGKFVLAVDANNHVLASALIP